MPYVGNIRQTKLQSDTESAAGNIFNAIEQMENYVEKVTSFAAGRDATQIAQDMWDKDDKLDKVRFPDVASLQVFIEDATAVTQAFSAITGAILPADRAKIVKFA